MKSIVFVLALLVVAPAVAQTAVTADDYARGEGLLRQHTSSLVFRSDVRPQWMSDDQFWYRVDVPGGAEFVSVDAATGARSTPFDAGRMAAALGAMTGRSYHSLDLPFGTFDYDDDLSSISYFVDGRKYTCELANYTCTSREVVGCEGQSPRQMSRCPLIPSPDGTREAFIRDYNLWVRDLKSKDERQLTFDGIEDFGYATNNAGWTKSDRPVLVWSPDSKKIATFQHDGRGVGEMYLVSTEVGHPNLEAWKYPLPGDSLIFRIERVVIDVDAPRVVRLQMPPDAHRSTITDHVVDGGTWADLEWSADSSELIFVSSTRDHKQATLRVADPETGAVRDVLEERVETQFESGVRNVSWRSLPASNEVIWFSARSDWGHLYLYDLATGELKNPITTGEWVVLEVLRVDEDRRQITFMGGGREAGDPYFAYLYRVNFDGTGLTLLTPEPRNHVVSLSPSGDFFVDSRSTPTEEPITVLRDRDGRMVVELERADISQLVASGWQPPIPFTVKARDGETDLYGLMYRPTNFDASRKYPILNYLYPGPQTGSVGSRSFTPSRSDKQAVAELGFVVVELDAMGTPGRSKSFHDAYYGNMGDNGLPDQVSGIQQLAARHAWMDIDKVGIWGHSGGGFASTAGILRYPDFYKVAVSGAGNHDNATYEDDWGERYQGLLVENEDGTSTYDNQANRLQVENLKGKLLIAHGTMDSNVPPNNTLKLVEALMDANKDFDLLMFPNSRHGFRQGDYWMRRRWDYFVKHLIGVDPPKEFDFGRQRVSVGSPTG